MIIARIGYLRYFYIYFSLIYADNDDIFTKTFVRCDRFLSLWEAERCKMIEMSCDQHDEYAANSQFITHLTGRILWQQNLLPTPIDTKGFQTVLNLVENTCKDSFDLFFGLYFLTVRTARRACKISQRSLPRGAMVEPLRDVQFFRRVVISMGVLVWPNGYDLDAINLYDEMKRCGALDAIAAE